MFGPNGVAGKEKGAIGARARQRLFEALQAVHLRGETHITVRELRAALVYILFGVHSCDDYHGETGEAALPYWDRAFLPDSYGRQGEVLAELPVLTLLLRPIPRSTDICSANPIQTVSKQPLTTTV